VDAHLSPETDRHSMEIIPTFRQSRET